MALMAATLVAALSPASAQMLSDRQTVIPITFEALETFLDDAGWRYERRIASGEDVIVAEIEKRTIILWPRACNQDGVCAGLLSFAVIGDLASAKEVNRFNNRFHAARATLREGRVIMDSYTYADFGVVRGSLLIELAVLAGLVDDWWDFAKTDIRRQTPYATMATEVSGPAAPIFPFTDAALESLVGLNDQVTGSSHP